MWRVAHPVHEAQRRIGQEPLAGVVFDDHGLAGHPNSFAQQRLRIRRVVKHIDEHGDVYAAISVRDRGSIERHHGNRRIRAHQDIDPADRQIRSSLGDETVNGPVTAPDIEYRRVCWQQVGEQPA